MGVSSSSPPDGGEMVGLGRGRMSVDVGSSEDPGSG